MKARTSILVRAFLIAEDDSQPGPAPVGSGLRGERFDDSAESIGRRLKKICNAPSQGTGGRIDLRRTNPKG